MKKENRKEEMLTWQSKCEKNVHKYLDESTEVLFIINLNFYHHFWSAC